MELEKAHREKLLIELEKVYLKINEKEEYMKKLADPQYYCYASIELFLLKSELHLIKEIIAHNEIDL